MEGWIIIGGAWLLSPIVLLIAWLIARSKLNKLRRDQEWKQTLGEHQPAPSVRMGSDLSVQDTDNLLLLRMQLKRELEEGSLEQNRFDDLSEKLDEIWVSHLRALRAHASDHEWARKLDEAWKLLVSRQEEPIGVAPWVTRNEESGPEVVTKPAPAQAESKTPAPVQVKSEIETPTSQQISKPESEIGVPTPAQAYSETPPSLPVQISQKTEAASDQPIGKPTPEVEPERAAPVSAISNTETPPALPVQARQESEKAAQAESKPMPAGPQFTGATPMPGETPESADDFAWTPTEPSALEKLMQTMSGWGKLAAPFLAQNIGWFIGGFCFIAGTVFLVSYTSGFTNALVIFASLFLYTSFLFGAGYQIRAKRPELTMSSTMLLGIAMLLVPLTITAGTGLIGAAWPSMPLIFLSTALAVFAVAAFYYAANLSGGVLDRALQGGHPKTFMALVSLQLAAPVVAGTSSWLMLAGLHALILGVTAFGLVKFVREWGKAIFVDRSALASYAGGLLIFAAIVSFVHLSVVYPGNLPRGYFGPFLMALSGVLFYVDSALKQFHGDQPYLSRFTFAIYGLSALALALCIEEPTARIITLALGAGIYASVTFKYLTLPPLYLMLACMGGLYGFAILANVPNAYWLLAAGPGLLGLLYGLRQFGSRSKTVGATCLSAFTAALIGLTGWTLFHAQPGWIALGSLLIASALSWAGIQSAKQLLVDEDSTDDALAMRLSRAIASPYALTTLAGLSIAYAPRIWGIEWATQLGMGLVSLALIFVGIALGKRTSRPTAEALVNSALIALLLAISAPVAFVAMGALPNSSLILPLALSAAVSIWMGISLRLKTLVYVGIVCVAIAGAIFKHTYFPSPSSGKTEMLLVVGSWLLLWWLERLPQDWLAIKRNHAELQAEDEPDFNIMSRIKAPLWKDARSVLRAPLRQAMAVLWLAGLAVIGGRLFSLEIDGAWPVATLIGTGATLLIIGYFRFYLATPVALFLGLCALLGFAFDFMPGIGFIGLCTLAAMYLISVWGFTLSVAARPSAERVVNAMGFAQQSGWRRMEQGVHIGTLVMAIAGLAVATLMGAAELLLDGTTQLDLLVPLTVLGAYFAIVGRHYRSTVHSYFALGTLSIGLLLLAERALFAGWSGIYMIFSPALGLAIALTATAFWLCSVVIERIGNPGEFSESLYRKPLRVSAIVLALLATGQQLFLAFNFLQGVARYWSGGCLLLPGAVILVSNKPLRWRWAAYAGVGILTFAALLIAQERMDVNLLREFAVILAALSLALASMALVLQRRTDTRNIHEKPLFVTSTITFALALFGIILSPLETMSRQGSVVAAAAMLCLAIFPLAGALEHQAARVRGIMLPLLLSAFAFAISGYSANATILVVWGFALWAIGNLVLPRFNARFSQWAVSDTAWPWFGLVFVAAGAFFGIVETSILWTWLAAASAYAFLMLRDQKHEIWMYAGAILGFLSTLAVWLVWIPESQVSRLLPWYAIQTAAAFWLLVRLRGQLDARLEESQSSFVGKARRVSNTLIPVTIAASISMLVLHATMVFGTLSAGVEIPWLFGLLDMIAVAATCVLLALPVFRNVDESSNRENRIYGLAALLGAFALYLRMVFLGLAAPTVLDTTALIGAAYLGFFAYRYSGSKALFNIALFLPIVALFTVTWQAGSGQAGMALIASAGLYLMMRGDSKNPIPLYLAVLAVNAAVYLWVPVWSESFGLLQLYAIPAAVSVLMLLQMHRKELRPNVLNGTRLAALSVIFASAGADMFTHSSLGVFALALGIGIAGAAVGIALRIRIFLYASVAFLVLTVLSQLTQFYPEQQLARALMLMGLGVVITAGMVVFNMKREQILARVRVFRADLESWD